MCWSRFVVAAAGLLAIAMAGSALADAGWTETSVVSELNPMSRHYYAFRLHDVESPADCRAKNGFYQDYKSRGASKMFDALLEAVASNLKVKVFVTGKCNLNGFAEISSVVVSR